jgi:hypothetical protein
VSREDDIARNKWLQESVPRWYENWLQRAEANRIRGSLGLSKPLHIPDISEARKKPDLTDG